MFFLEIFNLKARDSTKGMKRGRKKGEGKMRFQRGITEEDGSKREGEPERDARAFSGAASSAVCLCVLIYRADGGRLVNQ